MNGTEHMRVVEVPPTLDYRSTDSFCDLVAAHTPGPVLFDAHRLRWVDPNGMLALLAAGTYMGTGGEKPRITLPDKGPVAGYMDRMGFASAASEVFQSTQATTGAASGRESDVLLEVTPVTRNADIHTVVDRVQSRAGTILSTRLRYPAASVVQFSVVLSEVCQNIVEHAGAAGWVAAQSYNWTQRMGRRVAVIAVSDLGCGFRESLAGSHADRFGDRWGDATALEAAFLLGLTRFRDAGRGQGIKQIRKQVARWNGLLSIRSGTARIADIPDWSKDPPLKDNLGPFPGSQINIILPERINE